MKRLLLFILCFVFVFALWGCEAEKSVLQDSEERSEEIEKIMYNDGELVASTPDETGARPAQIPGFTLEASLSAKPLPRAIKGSSLQLIAVGRYSGCYTEDGTDDTVTDISAVVVQNISEKCVKNATIVLVGKDAKEYVFSLTMLPGGCSALLLESNRSVWQNDESISDTSAIVEEAEQSEINEDKLKITFKDGKLNLKNLTDKDFRAVYVRYKNYTAGNVYMGGVTYSASFDNVAAGGEYGVESVHYFEGYSNILLVQIVE